MRKDSDSERASGLRIPFVWDTSVSADAESSEGATGERRLSRKRVAVLGTGVLVVLCGAAYGAHALTSPQHPDPVGAAAMTQPTPLLPSRSVSATPWTSPSPSPSASPSHSATPTVTHTTAAAAAPETIAAAPTTSRARHVVAAAPPTVPAAAGDWLLNQTTGNTAVDSTGAHDATAQDGWWAGGTCLFNGQNSQIYTSGPVLSTGAGSSFTVSAWVDMTALPASGQYDETAVSQDGGVNSGFYLQFTEPDDRWAFSRTASNTDNPSVSRAESASAPALNTWTHLVGVYDAADNTQYLYVNGVAQGTATDSTPFSAPGDLAIGRAQYAGQETDWLKGAIKKVEVFSSALSAAQVSELS